MSLKRRLILHLTILIAFFWCVAALVSRSVVVEEINEITAETMSVAAMRLMPLVVREVEGHDDDGDDDEHHGPRELEEELRFMAASGDGLLAFELRDRDGVVKLRSFDAEDFQFPRNVHPGFQEENDITTYTVADRETGLSLTVGEPDSHREEAIREATFALFTPLLLIVPLIALAIIFVSRRAIEPVRELRRQISQRGGTNFDRLDLAGQPEELRPIADAVDRLLQRLRAAMEAEREFAANSAHELRTPIAGALAQVQRLKAELDEGPGRERAEEIEATMKRLAEFTDKLLQLSRVDAQPEFHDLRENMAPVLDLVIRDFTQRSENPAKIVFENHLGQDLIVAMDPDALAIAVRNLLENAVLHGDKNAPIELVVEKDWSIHVINSGPVVPQARLRTLTNRYARGETTATGSGLGLSIVDRIMTNSGGSLSLHSPATGREDGFEAVLHLP